MDNKNFFNSLAEKQGFTSIDKEYNKDYFIFVGEKI